jgi:hypothetical protein
MANDDGAAKRNPGEGYSFGGRRRDDYPRSFEEIQAIAQGTARIELNQFSKDVLDWNYLDPKERREHQRKPGEILADIEERRLRYASLQKRVGAVIVFVVVTVFTSFVNANWAAISAFVGRHL